MTESYSRRGTETSVWQPLSGCPPAPPPTIYSILLTGPGCAHHHFTLPLPPNRSCIQNLNYHPRLCSAFALVPWLLLSFSYFSPFMPLQSPPSPPPRGPRPPAGAPFPCPSISNTCRGDNLHCSGLPSAFSPSRQFTVVELLGLPYTLEVYLLIYSSHLSVLSLHYPFALSLRTPVYHPIHRSRSNSCHHHGYQRIFLHMHGR